MISLKTVANSILHQWVNGISPQCRLTSALDLVKTRMGFEEPVLGFQVQARFTATYRTSPDLKRFVDHKTILAVTNVAAKSLGLL